nr:HAD-IB family phosphatase [Parvularcula maris]
MDRTITRRSTWRAFLDYASKGPVSRGASLLGEASAALRYALGQAEREEVKIAGLRARLAGRSRDELRALAARFTEDVMQTGLRPYARQAIEAERERGSCLVLATAAIDLVADRFGQALGFDHVVATELSWNEDERLSPHLATPNCYGTEKERRVMGMIEQQGGTLDFMASDHHTDLPLLTKAPRGLVVNPKPGFAQEASGLGLEIADWETP